MMTCAPMLPEKTLAPNEVIPKWIRTGRQSTSAGWSSYSICGISSSWTASYGAFVMPASSFVASSVSYHAQGVTHRDAPVSKLALVDLERAPIRGVGVVNGAGIAPAGLHVEDADDAAIGAVEGDRERDQGVLHPEWRRRALRKGEDHPGVVRELRSAHEPARPFRGRVGDLHVDDHLVVARFDHCPWRVVAALSRRGKRRKSRRRGEASLLGQDGPFQREELSLPLQSARVADEASG